VKPYKLLSLLLQYPDDELLGVGGALAAAAAELPRGTARTSIGRFLDHWASASPSDLREDYVRTFDFDRRASLHLTYHTHGDRRQRGLELVRLKRRFAEAGLVLGEGELPDYLPVLLEFAELAPDGAGAQVLAELREPLELVRAALHERGSPYAGLLDALVAGLPKLTRAQLERVRQLAAEGPPAELVGLEPFLPAAGGAG
jgi:nitrate reductase delta subunit